MKIKFLGASQTVTGSCFLVDTDYGKFLVDCGMFQGEKFEKRNYYDFEFDPKEIDFVVVTHSHLDHAGLLPKLYKQGFRGDVFMSTPTRAIADNMLMDSAKVQEIKFREAQRGSKSDDDWELDAPGTDEANEYHGIIYDTPDVIGVLGLTKELKYGEIRKINSGLKVKLLRVGHALGASSVEIDVKNSQGKMRKLLFSGDIGNSRSKLDSIFDYPTEANYVIMESLYGQREHDDREYTEKTLSAAINQTLDRGGNVLIPAFTYQRSQEILYLFKRFLDNGVIPKKTRIYLDSPLALRNLEVYKKYHDYLGPKENNSSALFSHPNFVFSRSQRDSKRINKARKSIIIAGHGMCVGGRIRHHLIHNIEDKRASVIFIGYQAENTLGRELIEGAENVKIDKVNRKVEADIIRLFGFSAHGDRSDLLRWLEGISLEDSDRVFLVHAEEQVSKEFGKELLERGYKVTVPEWKQEFELE